MGRPRQHDDRTAAALIEAAERTAEAAGPEALSMRRVADEAGTTTRAVYSLFGSKDGLMAALGRRAFDILGSNIRAMPITDDPAADLAEAGVAVFRRFALEHPSLFSIGVQRRATTNEQATGFRASQLDALDVLKERVARLRQGDDRRSRAVVEATTQFHALCEGLAALELRGVLPAGREEQIWRSALTALVAGLANQRATRSAACLPARKAEVTPQRAHEK